MGNPFKRSKTSNLLDEITKSKGMKDEIGDAFKGKKRQASGFVSMAMDRAVIANDNIQMMNAPPKKGKGKKGNDFFSNDLF